VGWGFQLQSPALVAALALLFFGLGLWLLGLATPGASLQAAAAAVRPGRGLAGSFASGALATAVATPCTAPFMGAALGYALLAPPGLAFLVFTLLGLGMALPYLLLPCWPALLARLPRPGPWTVRLQQLLSFPLFATVVWLSSVLVRAAGAEQLLRLQLGLLLVGLALWLYRQLGGPGAGPARRLAARAAALALIASALLHAGGGPVAPPAAAAAATASAEVPDDPAARLAWADWSEERVALLRSEGRPLFVDFTAAWCLTCQVNEQLVFSSAAVRERLAGRGVQLLRADWTRSDPAITRALSTFGRSGVPLMLLYGAGEPEVLPTVLGPRAVLEALDRLVPEPREGAARNRP
jgi:thiol:disulfide interchange protein DsbD